MATTKADAHFVDCDIDPQTPATWDWEFGGYIGDYQLTYMSEDAQIWGVPLYDKLATGLDVGGVPIEVNGKTGYPMSGHPFSAGQTVIISGCSVGDNNSNNSGVEVLSVSSTHIVVDKTWDIGDLETFTGNEKVCHLIGMSPGLGRSCQDNDGNIYYGHQTTGSGVLVKIEPDGTQTYFSPTTAHVLCNVHGLVVSPDGATIYMLVNNPGWGRIYKIDVATFTETDFLTPAPTREVGWDIDVDSTGDFYIPEGSETKVKKYGNAARYSGTDGSKEYSYSELQCRHNLVVDSTVEYAGQTGIIVTAGSKLYNEPEDAEYYAGNIFLRAMDDSSGTYRLIGTPIAQGGALWETEVIHCECVRIFNGFIYVALHETGKIYKLDLSLDIVAEVDLANVCGIWFDLWGNLVAMSDADSDLLYYDTDLVLQETVSSFNNTMLDSWRNTEVTQGNVFFFPGLGDPTKYVAPGSRQYRTVAYPQDYAHLEGQEVQVLADGIYLDDDTYTVSSGAVSPTYTATTDHVGLQVVSKLQPMKIDGEVHVKKIRQIIPDVFESVGGEYGKELDDMYTMELRATNDIMERDNALYSGYVELPYKGQYDRSGDMWFTQDIPLPLTLLGVGVRLSKEDI
jgi:hypothetical protein